MWDPLRIAGSHGLSRRIQKLLGLREVSDDLEGIQDVLRIIPILV
jgi:hypothetical protein